MNMLDATPLHFPANAIIRELDPLIITSPTPRSGTTLLQRLLCSSRRALIYGEKCAYDLEFFLNIYAYKAQEYGFQRERYQQDLQKVLNGEVNDWILTLAPDVDGYLAAIQAAVFAGVRYCRDYALSVGRPVWGFKYPGWDAATIRLLQTVMPKARFIFIYRDLIACLKSAKAQHSVTSKKDVRDFCQKWATGADYMKSVQGHETILGVDFDILTKQPETIIENIAKFSGVHDIDRSVLDHKINIWAGLNFTTQTQDGYLPPVELSQDELSIVDEFIVAVDHV